MTRGGGGGARRGGERGPGRQGAPQDVSSCPATPPDAYLDTGRCQGGIWRDSARWRKMRRHVHMCKHTYERGRRRGRERQDTGCLDRVHGLHQREVGDARYQCLCLVALQPVPCPPATPCPTSPSIRRTRRQGIRDRTGGRRRGRGYGSRKSGHEQVCHGSGNGNEIRTCR